MSAPRTERGWVVKYAIEVGDRAHAQSCEYARRGDLKMADWFDAQSKAYLAFAQAIRNKLHMPTRRRT